jgi:NADPH-dependent curcumin reductase CurA
MPDANPRIMLARRPTGAPVPDDFRLEEAPIPDLAEARRWCGTVSCRSTPTSAAAWTTRNPTPSPVPLAA